MTHQPDPFFALRAAGTAGAIILANEGRHGRPLNYHVVNADGATPEFCCEPHEYLAVVPFSTAEALQAKIDALMLEYCPDEVTPAQFYNWAAHQVPAPSADGDAEMALCLLETAGFIVPGKLEEARAIVAGLKPSDG